MKTNTWLAAAALVSLVAGPACKGKDGDAGSASGKMTEGDKGKTAEPSGGGGGKVAIGGSGSTFQKAFQLG